MGKLTVEKWRDYQNVCTRLRLKYPKAFVPMHCSPLKIGISDELVAQNPDMDARMIRRFLRFYCSHSNYLIALTKRRMRVGLDGKSVEAIAPDAKQFAIEQIARRAVMASAS